MKRDQAIERLCILITEVGKEVFSHKLGHDCICTGSKEHLFGAPGFDMNELVLEFVEKAVRKEIKYVEEKP